MKRIALCMALAASLLFAGCYHAQITTDRTPSSTVIENQWAMSFVYGLVPPPVVETAEECPNGLARVETRISFLNGLVGSLSAGLITPMHIKVTCAAGGNAMNAMTLPEMEENAVTISSGATDAQVAKAIQKAAQQSLNMQQPVNVRFDR